MQPLWADLVLASGLCGGRKNVLNFHSATLYSLPVTLDKGSVKQWPIGDVHCKMPSRHRWRMKPLHLRKYDFMPCTVHAIVGLLISPHANTEKTRHSHRKRSGYSQCGPRWHHEQAVWNSINSWKYDKSFRHAVTSWSGSHSSSGRWQNWCQEQIMQHLTDPPKTNCQPFTHTPVRTVLRNYPVSLATCYTVSL